MIIQDTGLGFERTYRVVVITAISRHRSIEMKQRFYSLLVAALEKKCGIAASDVMVSVITNRDEDWIFGLGRAQFLTGAL